ncbi:hypothetical protein [Devosia sp. SL43]|uniref:hypothetical protein n=1 Tax=Devosia sp. SL43 TaxID=2806348 RepID=UPI001F46C40B|nr:hypothetical protein [Devosia sp. SL43]UJW87168.1 hypothetical protein IM737_07985 [Devosia sp. SL43]
MAKLTAMDVLEIAFCVLGGIIGAGFAGTLGYFIFAVPGAIVLGLIGLILGFICTRAGADWMSLFP